MDLSIYLNDIFRGPAQPTRFSEKEKHDSFFLPAFNAAVVLLSLIPTVMTDVINKEVCFGSASQVRFISYIGFLC